MAPELETPEATEFHETEKILRWRWVRWRGIPTREYLVLRGDQLVDKMSWVPEAEFVDPDTVHQDLAEDKPKEILAQ